MKPAAYRPLSVATEHGKCNFSHAPAGLIRVSVGDFRFVVIPRNLFSPSLEAGSFSR